MLLQAEIGTGGRASYCQTPRNRRGPLPQSLWPTMLHA